MANAQTAPIASIEKSQGPDPSVVHDFLEFTNKHEDEGGLVAGDKVILPDIKEKPGFSFIEAKAEEMPPYDERDDDLYEDFETKLCVTVHVDSSKHNADGELKAKVKNWVFRESIRESMKVINEEVIPAKEGNHVVKITVLVDTWFFCDDGNINFVGSPFYDDFWNKYMNGLIKEGVCYVKKKVPQTLQTNLRKNLDEMARKTAVDYHPNSNDIVRDLVHPALYPFIKGVSKVKKSNKQPPKEEEPKDFWGRKYENSNFQWLPAPFRITEDGTCLIQEYINNLDRNIFPELYEDLQSLFEVFLPYFEEVWSYAKAMEFFQGDDGDVPDIDVIPPIEKKPVSFKGQELQVITKIVEYTLQPGQAYEGVWHAEGMSHENIVMTGIYFLDRDPDIVGGDLRFKRAFTVNERSKVFFSVPQTRPVVVNVFASEGFVPLGYFPTEQDYLLVFPNCHIHKIAKMINTSQNEKASRRIVVFFFINPEKKIISTREVPPQQDVISLRAAKNYRLELMAERKYDKESLNVRDIELCEH